jgi:hypothetical protein
VQIKNSQDNQVLINGVAFYKKYKKTALSSFLVLLFLSLLFFCIWANRTLKTKGYTGLWDFAHTISTNYLLGRNANSETISIEIKDKDINILEKNRKKALERGVIINDLDGEYVSGTLAYHGKKIKIKLRLKGHMTDHLQDNKWSFRIKVKDKDSFMGMKRFSIQHPGTRGYIYEWIFHELMKREDVIALKYKFINVAVNGKDWGVYALEENFEEELIENNNRKKGPIVRFNPDLYWADRYNELIGSRPTAEFASYYSSNMEAYREEKIISDSTQRNYYLKALAMVEGVRSKKIAIDQAFDISRLAKFHAIIDLVGGQHSIDWSDIKYYYNPISEKLEPVSYESFTNFPISELSGMYKFVELDSNSNYENWHSALFSNPIFFKAYVHELERISSPSYLDDFFNASSAQLDNNLAILYSEFPYKKFDKKTYYANQVMIKKMLSPSKAFHAYFNKFDNHHVYIQLGAIESMPSEIKSITIGGVTIKPKSPIFLPSKQPNTFVRFCEYDFVLPANITWDNSMLKSLKVNYTMLGANEEKQEHVFPFPHTDSEFIANDLKNRQGNIAKFSFLSIDEINKVIVVKSGKNVVTENLIIPAGYQLIATAGVTFDLTNNSKIQSYSPLLFTGSEDEPIVIESSDSTGQGFEIIGAPKSKFVYVVFKKLPKILHQQWNRTGAITFYESPVEFNNCNFYDTKAEDAINLIRSPFLFDNCLFHKLHDDAIDIDYSEGVIKNCVFENCKENAIDMMMGKVQVNSIYVNNAGNKAINTKAGSLIKGNDVRIKNAYIAISAEDLSEVNLQNVTITDTEIGVVAYKNKPDGGHPTIKIKGLMFNHVKTKYLKEKKSSILINGSEINEEVDHVETIIKSVKKK